VSEGESERERESILTTKIPNNVLLEKDSGAVKRLRRHHSTYIHLEYGRRIIKFYYIHIKLYFGKLNVIKNYIYILYYIL